MPLCGDCTIDLRVITGLRGVAENEGEEWLAAKNVRDEILLPDKFR